MAAKAKGKENEQKTQRNGYNRSSSRDAGAEAEVEAPAGIQEAEDDLVEAEQGSTDEAAQRIKVLSESVLESGRWHVTCGVPFASFLWYWLSRMLCP